MSNLTLYPVQDWYESSLSQPYDWTWSTIYVDSIPVGTLESWQEVIFTINPWTSYAQAVKVSWWTTGQLNVSSTTVEKANGTNYTTRTHGAKSPIIISDNFSNWEAIANAVNSKSDTASPAFTGYVWLPTYADVTARNTAIPSPTGKELVIVAGDLQHYNSTISQREIADTGTPTPNASTTVSGKVEEATQAEVEAGTDTGWTWARNFITPSKINPANITSATIATDDKISFSDISDSNKLKSTTMWSIFRFWGDGSDWAVDGTASVTITWSNNTYIVKNYSSRAAGSAPRIFTVTPTGCTVHIKIKGDADFSNRTFEFGGKGTPGGVWSSTTTGTVGTSTTTLLQFSSTWGWVAVAPWGWGWGAGNGASGTGGTTPSVKWNVFPLTSIQGRRCIEIGCWSGWGWGGWNGTGSTGWTGWAGGWCLIIEVLGNPTVNNSTTVVNMNWAYGANSTGSGSGWGWGWGWGWSFYFMYSWTLSGTFTPTVAWGAGGTAQGSGTNGSAWGVWLALIEQNKVFS